MDSRQKSLFEDFLESEPAWFELLPRLDLQSRSLLARTCKGIQKVVQEPLNAAKLLRATINADWDMAEKLVQTHPELLLQRVLCTFPDGRSENISPLEHAVNELNTDMWRMFEDTIRKLSPQYLPDFYMQLQQHSRKIHDDLKIVFDAYEHCRDQSVRWKQGTLSDDEIDAEILNLGKVMRQYLPIHMLKEFCRKGDAWHPKSGFNDTQRPVIEKVFNVDGGGDIALLPFRPVAGLGYNYMLARGKDNPQGAIVVRPGVGGRIHHDERTISHDLYCLRRLYLIRSAELDQRLLMINEHILKSRSVSIHNP